MLKRTKRILLLLLSITLLLCSLTACMGEEVEVPVLIPEKQIFIDKYERNPEITNTMTYAVDYMSSKGSLFSSMDVVSLFNHIDVQVDNWDCVTVGVTTMGEIATIIDTVNDNYVIDNTNKIIAERQAIIDKEYEEAVKKAESKGKTYDKPKKTARTDDIHFDEPYTYNVTLGDNSKALPEEYKPTLLVDPKTYDVIYFDVAKYGIPYVRFEFHEVSKMYNTKITQESDWIVCAVKAADVSSYVENEDDDNDEEMTDYPDFVDVDMRNKAAKQNIVMSGNIVLGGDGFTWDSLMLLCNALQLEYDSDENGFEQSSDENFTYYTILLHTNPFEYWRSDVQTSEKINTPMTRLIATFDPLSQVCVNWTVDVCESPQTFNNKIHDLSEPIKANVHEFQVDTNNYSGMRETIKTWVATNAIETTTAYCMMDDGKIVGKVDTGLANLFIEPVVDGVTYVCLEQYNNADGSLSGKFISQEDLNNAENLEDQSKYYDYVDDHTEFWQIACCILDDDGDLVSLFYEEDSQIHVDGEIYYVADYEFADGEYRDIRLLTEDSVSKLIKLYTKTYLLDKEQSDVIQDIVRSKGVIAVRNYVNELFAEAEEQQRENAGNQQAKLLSESAEINTNNDISAFKINGEKFTLKSLDDRKIKKLGFTPGGVRGEYSDLINMIRIEYIKGESDSENQNVSMSTEYDIAIAVQNSTTMILKSNSDVVSFYNGICVGMNKSEIMALLNEDEVANMDNTLITKSDAYTLIMTLDDGEVVESVYLVANDYYKTMPRAGAVEEESDEQIEEAEPTEGESEEIIDLTEELMLAETHAINTEADVSAFNIGDTQFDIEGLTVSALGEAGFEKTMSMFMTFNEMIQTAGVNYSNETVEISVEENAIGDVVVISTDSNDIVFYSGIKVGMSLEDVQSAIDDENIVVEDGYLVLKNDENTLVIVFNFDGDAIDSIHLVNNGLKFKSLSEVEQVVEPTNGVEPTGSVEPTDAIGPTNSIEPTDGVAIG